MAFDIVPNNFWSFPSRLPSIFDDDDDWSLVPNTPGGLSISEDAKNVYIEAAVPGIDPNNIEITYEKGALWIKGQVQEEEKNKQKKYYRKASQEFSYRVAVPGDIDPNAEPEAECANGMVKVTFAKSPKSQPKRIQVKANKK